MFYQNLCDIEKQCLWSILFAACIQIQTIAFIEDFTHVTTMGKKSLDDA
jgi:hypothetical protein